MFGKPRQLETESELYDVAVRALMRRAHSVHEMKQKLARRSENKLLVQLVMARLKENGLIDDARYAKQFARQRTQTRKQGKFRVARDLRARGVPDRHIDAAVEEATRETDEGAVVRQRIERKLRSYRGSDTSKKSGPAGTEGPRKGRPPRRRARIGTMSAGDCLRVSFVAQPILAVLFQSVRS